MNGRVVTEVRKPWGVTDICVGWGFEACSVPVVSPTLRCAGCSLKAAWGSTERDGKEQVMGTLTKDQGTDQDDGVRDVEQTRAEMVGLLTDWRDADAKAKAATRVLGALNGTAKKPGVLRKYVMDHRTEVAEDPLYDGELGVEVEAKWTSAGRGFDIMSCAKDHPAAIVRLAELGLLSLNFGLWDKHPKEFAEADQAGPYIRPGGEQLSLKLVEKRR